MQDDVSAAPSLSRGRSHYMWQTFSSASSITTQNRRLIFANNEYDIIDSTFRNWITADCRLLASAGGNVFGREVLLIDPYNGRLAALLEEYITHIPIKRVDSGLSSHHQVNRLLRDLTQFVIQKLSASATVVQKIIDRYKTNPDNCLTMDDKLTPCINLEVFLLEGVGVCRHYAILCCLLMAFIMGKGYLPVGEIMLERANIGSSAHANAHYINEDFHWTLDPTKLLSRSTVADAVTYTKIVNEATPPTQPVSPANSPSSSQVC